MSEKLRENNVRRRLARQGYKLHKSRVRNTNGDNYGGYMITMNRWIETGERYDLSLEDVEKFADS